MEFQRIILLIALVIVSLLLWNAWQTENLPSKKIEKVAPSGIPESPISTLPQEIKPPSSNFPPSTPLPTNVPSDRIVTVSTDVLQINIDKLGGNITYAALPKFPESLDTPNIPVVLLSNDPDQYYVAETALVSDKGPDTLQTKALYQSEKNSYSLEPNQNDLTVALKWQNNEGLQVTKTYQFHRNDYLINMSYNIENTSPNPWQGKLYTQLTKKDVPQKSKGFFHINPYAGAAIWSPEEHYQQVSFKSLAEQNLNKMIQGGWLAMVQHYFLSAWVPPPNQTFQYYSQALGDNSYSIGMVNPNISLQPSQQLTIPYKLYVGPEHADRLQAIAPGLNLTVSYGWFWWLAVPIFWVMKQINHFVGNWGWAIVIVTILIKLILYPLSSMSYRSMANLRKLQPKIEMIREKYANEREKLSKAMIELYRQEKVNPLGGCLPILVQIPVFIALYMVLVESVELRQAPWILWIKDLSIPDPYFILPILMGATMYIQQKLNPPPPDPTQEKVMLFLPVLFVFIFLYFPAGLVLYWLVNNTVSILQQWYIMRSVELKTVKQN